MFGLRTAESKYFFILVYELSRRFCYMLAKTTQIFHEEPHEIAARAPGRKFEMISPGENRI